MTNMKSDADFEFDLYREKIVASVIAAAGGKLVGRVRLQKIVYLLDQLGLNSPYSYQYYHYGPYSEELSESAEFAKAFNFISEETAYRATDGVRFNVFTTSEKPDPSVLGELDTKRVEDLVRAMNAASSTVLELAATAHWVKSYEGVSDWKDEVVRRKGVKTQAGRLDQAVNLLGKIGLAA
jgi:uncharacterized protein YwgA